MFLKNITNGHLVEVQDVTELFDPFNTEIVGRYHYGEEVQEPCTLPDVQAAPAMLLTQRFQPVIQT